eukprot:8397655-Pyramimonas_sp.AAC.1
MKLRPHFQAAIPTPGGGTHGGVGAVVPRGFSFRRFLAGAGSVKGLGQGTCWMPLELRTKQSSIAIGIVYMVSDLGVCGEHVPRLQEIMEFAGTLAVHWVLM